MAKDLMLIRFYPHFFFHENKTKGYNVIGTNALYFTLMI